MPGLDRVLETSLYVKDVRRSAEFYRAALNLEWFDLDENFCALNISDRQLLLLFRKGAAESRVEWARGGTSLYFRDPDGHLIELATPGIWKIY